MAINFISQVKKLSYRSRAIAVVLLVLTLTFFNSHIKLTYAACTAQVRWTQLGLANVTTATRTGTYTAEATFAGCSGNGQRGYLIISASSLSEGSTKQVDLIDFGDPNGDRVVLTTDISITSVDNGHTIVAEAKVNNASGNMISGTQKKANLSVQLQGAQPGGSAPSPAPNTGPNRSPANTPLAPVNTQYTVGKVDYDASYGFLQPLSKAKSVPDYIALLLKLFFLGIAMWTVVMILIGSFRMIMSRGNTEAITAGKKTVSWAVIGLIIALLSYSIVAILQTALGVQ